MLRFTPVPIVILFLAACEMPPSAPDAQGGSTSRPSSSVRTTHPSADDPGVPFYARIGPDLRVDGWTVVVFYRDPSCIPAAFNLLTFFDPPTAFGCTATVKGHSIWSGEPFQGAPKVAQLSGLGAVPIWFIPEAAVLSAIADGVLTIGELAALPGRLTGHATQYQETLHPVPLPAGLGGGGHPTPKIVIRAQGALVDSRSFQYHLTTVDGVVRSTALRIR